MKMWRSAGSFLIFTFALTVAGRGAQQIQAAHSADYQSLAQKLAYLKANAAKPHPDPKPVELTEAEVNAYFNEGGAKLPKGVSQVHLSSRLGVIDGRAHVDFEEIMQGHNKNNPLYRLFSGSHDIHVVAEAAGANGVASIQTQTVELDNAACLSWRLNSFSSAMSHPGTPMWA